MSSKYNLDAEMSKFQTDVESFYPADAVTRSIEQNRNFYDDLCKAFALPIPDTIRHSDKTVRSRVGLPIPVRLYENRSPKSDSIILYFHGGGFSLGGLESHHSICADIAHQARIDLISVDYRLAPEFRYPAQVEDAVDVFLNIDAGKTIVAGDSAGGTLAAAVCVAQRDTNQKPIGQVLIYPSLSGNNLNLDSYQRNADAPGLSSQDVLAYKSIWNGGSPPENDPLFSPLALDDFTNIAPCIGFAAEFDPLCDDVKEYCKKINATGVLARQHIETGLIHAYLRARGCSKRARNSFKRICAAFVELEELHNSSL